jgi:hypothetical protein
MDGPVGCQKRSRSAPSPLVSSSLEGIPIVLQGMIYDHLSIWDHVSLSLSSSRQYSIGRRSETPIHDIDCDQMATLVKYTSQVTNVMDTDGMTYQQRERRHWQGTIAMIARYQPHVNSIDTSQWYDGWQHLSSFLEPFRMIRSITLPEPNMDSEWPTFPPSLTTINGSFNVYLPPISLLPLGVSIRRLRTGGIPMLSLPSSITDLEYVSSSFIIGQNFEHSVLVVFFFAVFTGWTQH